jgi:hypothetical protein
VVPLADDDVAEHVALALLHEALHARYSTSSGAYTAKRAALAPALQPAVEYLYQRIEDARVQRLAVNADASLAPHLLKFHDEGIRQREAQYRAAHRGAGPWTAAPASQRNQLFLAVERRLFHPGQTLTLDPAVAAELAKCEATIAPAWTGTTETSGLVAIAVAQQIVIAKLST